MEEITKSVVSGVVSGLSGQSTMSRRDIDEPAPVYHDENIIAGKTLESYTRRQADEEGKYVLVITHTERIEMIRQPLTPEEIAEKKRKDKIFALVVGGFLATALGIFGYATYKSEQQGRREESTAV